MSSPQPFQFIDPVHGDITEDVAMELARMTAEDDEQLFRDAAGYQRCIAETFRPTEARTFKCGHMVAQIDGRVYDYWRRREGKDFWKHERKNFLKKHPECAVIARSEKTTVMVDKPVYRVTGKRGRWAA